MKSKKIFTERSFLNFLIFSGIFLAHIINFQKTIARTQEMIDLPKVVSYRSASCVCCKNEKELQRYLKKQMKQLKNKQRRIHRKVAAISAIPLLITILSGTIYSFLQPLGIDAFWLIKWHTGNFGIINFQPFYSIFIGFTSIISVISGINLLKRKFQI